MKTMVIEAVRIKEICGCNIKPGDKFIFDWKNSVWKSLNNPEAIPCNNVFTPRGGTIRAWMGEMPSFASCVDAGYGKGNANVLFKISEEEIDDE